MIDDPKIIPFPTSTDPQDAVSTLLPSDSPIRGSLRQDDAPASFPWAPTLIVSVLVVAVMTAVALL